MHHKKTGVLPGSKVQRAAGGRRKEPQSRRGKRNSQSSQDSSSSFSTDPSDDIPGRELANMAEVEPKSSKDPQQQIVAAIDDEQRKEYTFTIDNEEPIVRVEEINDTEIKIQWGEGRSDTNKSYKVLWEKLNGEDKQTHSTNNEHFTLTSVVPGFYYRVKVKAIPGNFSDDLIVILCPAAPVKVIARNSELSPSDSVSVRFEDPDPTPKFFRVIIRNIENNEEEVPQDIDKTYHTFSGLQPGSTYEICAMSFIKNKHATGGEMTSRKSYALTEIHTYPAKVTLDNPEYHENNTVTIVWEAVKGATEYCVERTDGENSSFSTTSKTSLFIPNLAPGKAYMLSVAAKNVAGTGLSSESIMLKSSLVAPNSITVERSVTSPHNTIVVQFQYTDTADVGFEVVAKPLKNHAAEPVKQLTESTSVVLDKLQSDEIYQIHVTAVKEGLRSTKVVYPELIRMFLEAPTKVEVKHSARYPCTAFEVRFDYPNIGGIKFDIVAVGLDDQKEIKKPTSTNSAVIGKLAPGESYHVYVIAKTDKEAKNVVSEKSFHPHVIQTYPAEPKHVEAEIKNDSLFVKWEALDISPNKYRVFIDVDGKRNEEDTCHTSFTIANIELSTIFQIRVAGINDAGCGPLSKEIYQYSDPAPPTNPRVERNIASPQKSILVSFDDLDMSFKRYRITAMPSSGDKDKMIEMTTTEKAVAVCGLTPGQSYYVFVVAVMDAPDNQIRESRPVYCAPKK